MSFHDLVHKDDDGILWFGDQPVRGPADVPRRTAWKGALLYATAAVKPGDLAAVLGPEDVAFGPTPGEVVGAAIRVGTRSVYRIYQASTWGVRSRKPNRVWEQLYRLRMEAAVAGLKVKPSVARTAVQAYLDRYDGKRDHPRLQQLQPRWRGLAHAAFHGGPISVLRGSAPYAVQIDVRGAYLHALQQDVPVYGVNEDGDRVGGWITMEDRTWERFRDRVGFVDATVRVPVNKRDPGGIPPLPVHTPIGTVFAHGQFRGAWTIEQVREAEERGEVEIMEVHQFCVAAETRPLFAQLAEDFGELPTGLAKRLYTRFWARFASRGGFEGRFSTEAVEGAVPAAGLWWEWKGIDLESYKAPRIYRPDISACIASINQRHVLATTRKLAPGSVVATHVDAIWTTDIVGASRVSCGETVGSWRPKRSGPLRFYASGCYDHDGDLAAAGYDSSEYGTLTKDRLEGWLSQSTVQSRRLLETRHWTGDPATDPKATSTPLVLETTTDDAGTVPGPSVYDPVWSTGGWRRSYPIADDPPASVDAQPGDTRE